MRQHRLVAATVAVVVATCLLASLGARSAQRLEEACLTVDGQPAGLCVVAISPEGLPLVGAALCAELSGYRFDYEPRTRQVSFVDAAGKNAVSRAVLSIGSASVQVREYGKDIVRTLACVPELVAGVVMVPAEVLRILGGFSTELGGQAGSRTLGVSRPGAGLTALQGLRWSSQPDRFRLVLDLAAPVQFEVTQTPSPPRIVLLLRDTFAGSVQGVTISDPAISAVRVAAASDRDARVVVDLRYALPKAEVTALADPPRLVVDVPKGFTGRTEVPVFRGVRYIQMRMGTAAGQVMVDVLEVDPSVQGVAVRPVLAGPGGVTFGRETVRNTMDREGAVAAVNGVYFDAAGRPLGLLLIGGRLMTEPINARTAVGFTADGKVVIDRVDFKARLVLPGGTVWPVAGVNRPRQANEMVVYTRDYGETSGANEYGYEVAVVDGRVTVAGTRGIPIPTPSSEGAAGALVPSSYLLSGHGPAAAALAKLAIGDEVRLEVNLVPDWPSQGVVNALGGGPRLVAGGRVAVSGKEERFQPDVITGRAPRTALGVKADGKILLVAVTGRQGDTSIGMTLEELASAMVQLGAVDALNLDGGGSSTLVIRNYVINIPSDGRERKVGDAILVFAPPLVSPTTSQ